jgi:hypothetical protein
MATVVDVYRSDQFFILEQDTGAVIAGIAGGEVSVIEHAEAVIEKMRSCLFCLIRLL